MSRLHADELPIDVTLVRGLVDHAFPEHDGADLRALADSGSSNRLFRLGADKLVRLPRQPGGGSTIAKEATWLPYVARRVTAAVPTVLGVGEPDLGYPERWAITTWLAGAPARAAGPSFAADLARFVDELRGIDVPEDARADPTLSWYRGRRLASLDADFREALAACRDLAVDLDIDGAERVWGRAADASRGLEPRRAWYHGDLLRENLLVDADGSLAAVLDFGGLAVGDPTVDLIAAWELLDEPGRRIFRRTLDVDDATWAVSRGWAIFIAVMTFPYYGASMPARCADRLQMARAAVGDV